MKLLSIADILSVNKILFLCVMSFATLDSMAVADFTVNGINYSDASAYVSSGYRNRVMVVGGACVDSVLTIPKTVTGPDNITYTIEFVWVQAFLNRKDIKKISFPLDSDISILQGAFGGCVNLEEADLSHVQSVGPEAFKGCTKLSKVMLHDKLSYLNTSVFEGCSRLSDIDLSNITHLGSRALYRCVLSGCIPPRELQLVDTYALGLTSGIKSIMFTGSADNIKPDAFYGSGIETITLSCERDINLQERIFRSCRNLRSVSFSNR